jgi:hypothetical protein
MANIPKFARPPFTEALNAWKGVLAERHLPTELVWVFDENLCFENDPAANAGFKLGVQTRFAPPPPEADQIAYDYFCDFEARVVFYRIGSSHGKSVCVMLCDEWFEAKGESEGFIRRDEWLISFRPGLAEEIEEITDERRWKQRLLRNRPLHDLDFCMTLRAIHEALAHGRVLTSYEHYALRFFHVWRRLMGEKE